MANVFSNMRWILDTTGVITADSIQLRRLQFVPTADNSVCTIVDGSADQLWTVGDVTAAAWPGNVSIDFGDKGRPCFGFNVTVLGGTLYVDLM